MTTIRRRGRMQTSWETKAQPTNYRIFALCCIIISKPYNLRNTVLSVTTWHRVLYKVSLKYFSPRQCSYAGDDAETRDKSSYKVGYNPSFNKIGTCRCILVELRNLFAQNDPCNLIWNFTHVNTGGQRHDKDNKPNFLNILCECAKWFLHPHGQFDHQSLKTAYVIQKYTSSLSQRYTLCS
jgi:hypothetical protein